MFPCRGCKTRLSSQVWRSKNRTANGTAETSVQDPIIYRSAGCGGFWKFFQYYDQAAEIQVKQRGKICADQECTSSELKNITTDPFIAALVVSSIQDRKFMHLLLSKLQIMNRVHRLQKMTNPDNGKNSLPKERLMSLGVNFVGSVVSRWIFLTSPSPPS